jgi:hypothetical protein
VRDLDVERSGEATSAREPVDGRPGPVEKPSVLTPTRDDAALALRPCETASPPRSGGLPVPVRLPGLTTQRPLDRGDAVVDDVGFPSYRGEIALRK